MAITTEVGRLFEEARLMKNAALTLMHTGDIREAAGKAAESMTLAVGGMLVARTGQKETTSGWISWGFKKIGDSLEIETIREAYFWNSGVLLEGCYENGDCSPIEEIIKVIRETDQFIQDAERLADSA